MAPLLKLFSNDGVMGVACDGVIGDVVIGDVRDVVGDNQLPGFTWLTSVVFSEAMRGVVGVVRGVVRGVVGVVRGALADALFTFC